MNPRPTWTLPFIFASSLVIAAPVINNFPVSDGDIKNITKNIFPDTTHDGCVTLSRGPKLGLEDTDKTVAAFGGTILRLLDEQKWDGFTPLFHPLLKVGNHIGEKMAAIFETTYEKPWQFSIYRVWALHTVNGDPKIVPCDDAAAEVTTRYGYGLQFVLWIQLLAPNEISRIFVSVVPSAKDWRIGAWHISQWSHQGKDAGYWAKEARVAGEKGEAVASFVKWDIAQKLLDSGKFIRLREQGEFESARDQAMKRQDLIGLLNKTFKTSDVAYAASILAEDGAGIMIRERLKEALPTSDLQRRCLQRGKTLISEKVLTAQMGGLRCSYILPGEAAEKDGELGGFFYPRKDLVTKAI